MKTTIVFALALFLAACGNPSQPLTNANAGNGGGQSGSGTQTLDLNRQWAGTLTGHNFIGSPSFWFVISGSSVTNLVINLECPVDGVSVGMFPLAVSGTTLSGSYSGTLPDGTPVAVALQAQENVTDDTLTGTVTFSQPPCGTAQNPWVGGFTVKPAQ